jgi:hypothetical protein
MRFTNFVIPLLVGIAPIAFGFSFESTTILGVGFLLGLIQGVITHITNK